MASAQLVDPVAHSLPGGLSTVAEDMTAILARIPATPAPLPRGPLRRSIRHSRRWVMAAAALAVVCAGVVAERLSDPVVMPAQPKLAQIAEPAAPMAVRAPAAPLVAEADAAPARSETAPPPTRVATVVHRRSRAYPAFASGEHKPTRGCRGSEAWCLRDQVRAADRDLRNAYADAADAGVRYRTMAAVRSDWSRLRRLSDDDPRTLIRGYNMLAEQLRAEAGL